MANKTLSKSKKQREKKRVDKLASKDLKKAMLANVLQSLSQIDREKRETGGGHWEKGLVSAKSFGLKSAMEGLDAQKGKGRRKSFEKKEVKVVEEEEEPVQSEVESVDSFFTKPKEELFQKKEEPVQPKEPSVPIILSEK